MFTLNPMSFQYASKDGTRSELVKELFDWSAGLPGGGDKLKSLSAFQGLATSLHPHTMFILQLQVCFYIISA